MPLLVVAAAISGQLFKMSDISLQGYILLIVAGLVHFVVGRYGSYRAVGAMGTNRATPIVSLSGPYTLLMAVLLLGERISIINGIGIAIVVLAPALTASHSRGTVAHTHVSGMPYAVSESSARDHPSKKSDVSSPRLAEGYFFGIIGSLGFGSSPLLIRAAIGGTGLGIAGALVSYSAAAVLLILLLGMPGRLSSLRGMDHTAARWFLFGSVGVFFAQMFRFMALDLAPVTVVAPLQRTSVIFTLLFAFALNRRLEVFGPRVLAAIALSAIGSVFVVL